MYRIQTLDSYDLSDQHADKGRKYSTGGGCWYCHVWAI